MSKKGLLIVPVLFALLTCSAGCVIVNKAISTSAVADNLAVEKAQNEMLLLNVLRGKDHRPMYVTGIAKINGQVKAEASLGVTVPFGDVGVGHAEASHYVASPSATYNWNPNFDVIVFDTSEFMRGFLNPVSSDIFAYYWNLGFYPDVLFDLMVLKVQVMIEPKTCDAKQKENIEYILRNNHEEGGTEPVELEQFAEWVSLFLKQKPRFVEGKAEALGPPLTPEQAQKALIKGLREGLTLVEADGNFQFQRLAPAPAMLKLDPGKMQDIYNKTTEIASREIDGKKVVETYSLPETCSDDMKSQAATESQASAEPRAAAGTLRQSGTVNTREGAEANMTITLFLRSPEAILYYLGELARLEENKQKVPFLCIESKLEPLFVVRRGVCGKSAVEVSNNDNIIYTISTQGNEITRPSCEKSDFRELPPCDPVRSDPGRSMEALTVVAQLIALQKSAKDLPTTSVVRVVGQ